MVRHVPLLRMRAVARGDHGREGEAGYSGRKGFQRSDLDKIGIIGHAIDHVNGVVRRRPLQLLEHR